MKKDYYTYSNPTINEYSLRCEVGTLASTEEKEESTSVGDMTEEDFIW